MTTTPTQEPARAGELLKLADRVEDLLTAWSDVEEREKRDAIAEELRALARHLAQPAVPEGVDIVRKALELATVICDTVPARLHANGDEGWQYRLGVLVNKQPDGTHGYRLIQDALAALSTPQPATQESDVIELLETRIQLLRSALVRIERGAYPVTSATAALDKDRAVALSIPQPESAQGERGAVEGASEPESLVHQYARKKVQEEMEPFYKASAARRAQKAADDLVHAFLEPDEDTTPTGDQNARAVEPTISMRTAFMLAHDQEDARLQRSGCLYEPGLAVDAGIHALLKHLARHPVATDGMRCADCESVGAVLFQCVACSHGNYPPDTTPPAPVAQVGDGVAEQAKAARILHTLATSRDEFPDWPEGWDWDRIEIAIAALTSNAPPDYVRDVTEWRWVDERGRAMTHWKQGDPPPMSEVSDAKGTMRVELRVIAAPTAEGTRTEGETPHD